MTCMSGSKLMCTPASTITAEVSGMVMFWQISYGLHARVHVTVCPGAGIGGRLHVPLGVRRGFEIAAVAVRATNDVKRNINATLTISRVERYVNRVVAFILGLLGGKQIANGLVLRNTVRLLV